MIYLDHNATTPVLPEVLDAMMPWLTTQWGNPSSVHGMGRIARRAVEEARERVAMLVGAEPRQIIFTSGATESNNAAIHSALEANPGKRHVVTSAVEHSAVLAYCDFLESRHQVEVTRLPVDLHGMVSGDNLRKAIRPDTALVSLMWANNETGVIWPIPEFAKICAERGVPLHTDAVQAVGKVPVNFGASGAGMLSLSGHKIGAPKGIGALVVANPEAFHPFIYGGKQEQGMRGGTESVPLIVGLGKAAEVAGARGLERWAGTVTLRDNLEQSLVKSMECVVNGAGSPRLPNTTNLHFPGLDGDALMTYLDQKGICVSSGSACLASAITPSHVLLAMTGSHERASESLRISLGPDTTEDETSSLSQALGEFASLNS